MSIGNELGNAALAAFQQGQKIRTATQVNLRSGATTAAEAVVTMDPGSICEVTGGYVDNDGLRWWPLNFNGATGWAAESVADAVLLEGYQAGASGAGGISIHRPCDFPVTQEFGENPEFYSKIPGYAVPLRGHNGRDYGTPVGSAIYASDDGTVFDIRTEASGFGLHMLLQHSWGATLYAHLDQVLVANGQTVSKGQVIAKSGASGIGSGPHLHFGVKVYPSDRADGWGGYTDPRPYLEG